jgi:hypothetical protein
MEFGPAVTAAVARAAAAVAETFRQFRKTVQGTTVVKEEVDLPL